MPSDVMNFFLWKSDIFTYVGIVYYIGYMYKYTVKNNRNFFEINDDLLSSQYTTVSNKEKGIQIEPTRTFIDQYLLKLREVNIPT